MVFNNPYWCIATKIELLQQWILVHSYIYYFMNRNVVNDLMYDNNCKQLHEIHNDNPGVFKQTKYYDAFKDFNPATGFDLYSKLNKKQKSKIKNIAESLVILIETWE